MNDGLLKVIMIVSWSWMEKRENQIRSGVECNVLLGNIIKEWIKIKKTHR